LSNAVAKRSEASEAMVQSVAKARALMAGTAGMRAAGKTLLPQFPSEGEEAYQARLQLSWLFNGYRKAVRDYSGKVFSAPIALGDETPEVMLEWLENADLQGNDLSTFARRVFEDGIGGPGISYVMVDAPMRGEAVTREQARSENLRPYLVHLRAEDILGWKTEVINNVVTLSQVRIHELVADEDPRDEFAQVEVEQIRVLDRTPQGVTVRIFRRQRSDNEEKWIEVPDLAAMSQIPEITIAPFYANRTGFFTGAPMLDDLADVNIAHWQSQSDQRNILHAARVPILFAAGRQEDDSPIEISASKAVVSSDPSARLEWVEHSGAAIGAGRQDLKDLEFQMEAHGLQLLVARPGGQSATGEVLDAEKETSTLAMTADQLKDCLEMALIWMARYGGLGDVSPEVIVNKDFGVRRLNVNEANALLSAVNTGNLSRETYIRALVESRMIPEDVTPEDEAERIADEGGTVPGADLGDE
jgi:pimeloyl-ACP methyl ester carboxylesterase